MAWMDCLINTLINTIRYLVIPKPYGSLPYVGNSTRVDDLLLVVCLPACLLALHSLNAAATSCFSLVCS